MIACVIFSTWAIVRPIKLKVILSHYEILMVIKQTDLWPSDIMWQVDGLVQDNSISSALAIEILQSWTKPTILSW